MAVTTPAAASADAWPATTKSMVADLVSRCNGPADETPDPAAIALAADLKVAGDFNVSQVIAPLVGMCYLPEFVIQNDLLCGPDDLGLALDLTIDAYADDLSRQLVTVTAYDTSTAEISRFGAHLKRRIWIEMMRLARGSGLYFRVVMNLLAGSPTVDPDFDEHAVSRTFDGLGDREKVCLLAHCEHDSEANYWPSEQHRRLSRAQLATIANCPEKSITQARSRSRNAVRKAAGFSTSDFKYSRQSPHPS